MNQTAIFWPMLAHVALIYAVYIVLGWRRRQAVRTGATKPGQFKLRTEEPSLSVTAANNVLNQFELPVLFHVAGLSLFVTNGVNYLTLALMWLFVILRYAHAVSHLTTNRIRHRARFFAAGYLVLGLVWIWFALHLLGAV